jgi:hypothetical protein
MDLDAGADDFFAASSSGDADDCGLATSRRTPARLSQRTIFVRSKADEQVRRQRSADYCVV